MRLVLNETTKTAHRPAHSTDTKPADCGALRHVSDERIQLTTDDALESELEAEIDRCGRCFDGCGGY